MVYELKSEQFTGPIEKLLELIEGNKMEVTELSLAEVTDDFLKYLEGLKTDPTHNDMYGASPAQNMYGARNGTWTDEGVRILSDFIVVAARLLLIKSKALLPSLELTEEEKGDIKDLEERVRRYQAIKPLIKLFKTVYENKNISVSRPLFFGRPAVFNPPKDISVDDLRAAMRVIFESFSQFKLEVEKLKISLIKLEDKIEEIAKKIEAGIGEFSSIANGKSRSEIIVLFLALLHLLKDQIIRVEQKEKFSEMNITKIGS